MELDELKLAWRTLDARLQQQETLALHALHDRQAQRARRGLRPLLWGQLAQLLFGVATLFFGVSIWTSAREVAALMAAGLVLHGYGIAVVIASGMTLGLMQKLDYSAPVVSIQRQLAKLRRCYVISGMVTGLPWWLLWMLPPFVIANLRGDAGGMAWLAPAAAISIAGLLGTWWFHRWVRRPGREALARRMENSLTGASLRRAQAALDEVEAFERE